MSQPLLDKLLSATRDHANDIALVYSGRDYTYAVLEKLKTEWLERLESQGIKPGEVVAIKADYSPECVSLLLALVSNRNIAALIPASATGESAYLEDCQASWYRAFLGANDGGWLQIDPKQKHPLISQLNNRGHGGVVIFSSGSTGRPKAILHDIEAFLSKFETANKRFTTLTFLLFDHIAGLDTLFYGLASRGALVFPEKRDPGYICELIERHRIEVLPTSPSFLRLLCLSGELGNHDLSSLKIVTYGSEPMDEATLHRCQEWLPQAKFIQKYGMSELGSPRSKSRDDGSLWMKMGGNGFECRIVEGILWIRSKTAMMGYLNEPNPFDEAGWLCTGDAVEREGDWIRILGRQSEIIIVGGEKVYPQEVESVILEVEGVEDVVVKGETNPITGQVVTAQLNLKDSIDVKDLRKLVRKQCRAKLAPYKVPVKVEIVSDSLVNARNKKNRN